LRPRLTPLSGSILDELSESMPGIMSSCPASGQGGTPSSCWGAVRPNICSGGDGLDQKKFGGDKMDLVAE